MLNVESVLVLLIWWLLENNSFGLKVNLATRSGSRVLPWNGILRIKSGMNGSDAVAGLILIQQHLAVGNANELANIKINILRKFARAIFYRRDAWWSCDVSDCILHPEFFNGVKNTLALVHLKCHLNDVYWEQISWPTVLTTPDNVYTVGLTDRHRRLEQVIHRMKAVMKTECDDFYETEKLNYKHLHPSHSVCYKMLNSTKECVIDAGIALTARSENTWTLIGISTFGPGCSLPSRFIQFFPYIQWIKSHQSPVKRPKTFRRSNDWYKQGMEEPYEDQDTILLQKINDSSIVMRPSLAFITEKVHGRCNPIDGVLMYREFGTIRAPTYTATGVFSISLYDLFFPSVTCIMVTVFCNKRSKIRYWVTSGFHQEDIEDFIKIIPAPKFNHTKAPKILYLKDTYKKYRTIGTSNLEFKFEFTNEVKMNLEIYGRNVSSPMRPSNMIFLPKKMQTSGKLPDGADFNARDEEDNSDTNDSFYHF